MATRKQHAALLEASLHLRHGGRAGGTRYPPAAAQTRGTRGCGVQSLAPRPSRQPHICSRLGHRMFLFLFLFRVVSVFRRMIMFRGNIPTIFRLE